MDWNRSDDRAALVAVAPADGDPELLAKLAVVVRALADRDGVPVPAWVDRYTADRDTTLSGVDINGGLGRLIHANSPAASAIHRIYFDAELLDR
jgi:hypothetical protein